MRWAPYATGALLAACGPGVQWSPPPPMPPAIPESEWASFGSPGDDDPLSVWRRRLDEAPPERQARLLDVAPDGSRFLVATRFGEAVQAHLVTRPGGARRQLTAGADDLEGARFAGDVVVFWRDGEDGAGPLWTRPLAGGTPRRLPGPRANAVVVRPDGATLAVVDDAGGLHLVELDGTSRRLRTEVAGELVAFSADGTQLLLRGDGTSFVLDVADGEEAHRAAGGAVGWWEESVVLIRDGEVVAAPRTGSPTPWPGAPHDVTLAAVGPEGTLACVDGEGTLHVVTQGEARAVTVAPGRILDLRFAREAASLGLTWQGPDGSVDVFRVAAGATRAERWTESERSPRRSLEVRWEGGEGRLRLPAGPGPHPVVVVAAEVDDRLPGALLDVAGVAVLEVDPPSLAAAVARLREVADVDADRVAVWADDGARELPGVAARISGGEAPAPALTFADGPETSLQRDGRRWTFRAPRRGRRYASPADRRDALAAAVAFVHGQLIGSSPRGAPAPSR